MTNWSENWTRFAWANWDSDEQAPLGEREGALAEVIIGLSVGQVVDGVYP